MLQGLRMRTRLSILLLALAALPVLGIDAEAAGRRAVVEAGPAAVVAPAAAGTTALRHGMRYHAFLRQAGASGWHAADPLAADSCAAAGDCEIVFQRERAADQLHVRIGSDAGRAVIADWRFAPPRMETGEASELAADAGAAAPTRAESDPRN
jgi:hypothetical protein